MSAPAAPSYAAAGVDIGAAEENVRRIARHVRSTHGPLVLGDFGAFAGLYHLAGLRDPVLVASTDGVGTKLLLALQRGQHEVVGRDLVNLSVNDVLTTGARPLFFLDYIAVHRLDHAVVESLVRGMAAACRENGCALLGGETAQVPDLYRPGHYDLAGCVVGVVERDRLLDGRAARPGDRLWGLPSTGLHTNGYSLARRVVADARLPLDRDPGGLGMSLADALLAPHPSYLAALAPLLDAGLVRAAAHITGGGLPGNVPRVLPPDVTAEIAWGSWPVPPIFDLLRAAGGVPFEEMLSVFNLGLGVVFVTPADVDARALCPRALPVGTLVPRDGPPLLLRGAPDAAAGAPGVAATLPPTPTRRLRVGVLASGQGTNLQALLDAVADPSFPAEVALVGCNRPAAQAVERARAAGVPLAVVDRAGPPRMERQLALLEALRAADVDLVVLAGWDEVLVTPFVAAFEGRMINTHPSLLPAFGGTMHAVRQALEAGVRVTGCTVHLVTEEVDAGPILLQRCVEVRDDDDVESLHGRIRAEEHGALVEAVRAFAEGRVRVEGSRARVVASAH